MSATRLLILGVLRFMQPAHGYRVRRELEAWRAEQWANIAYGSIYFALNKMAEEGLVEAVDTSQQGKRPARTLYTVTRSGEEEFQRLLREYWWEMKPIIDPFQVALAFMDTLPRDELLAALRHRATVGRSTVEAFKFATQPPLIDAGPRHVADNLRLVAARIQAEVDWLEIAIGKVERGELP
jgi:DNA-binding PadR family transcriptional regulator